MADIDNMTHMLSRTRIPYSVREYPEDWVTRKMLCVESVMGHHTQFSFDSGGYLINIAWMPLESIPTCKVEYKYNA